MPEAFRPVLGIAVLLSLAWLLSENRRGVRLRPVVAMRACEVLGPVRRMGANGAAVSFSIRGGGAALRAVGFGMGDLADLLTGVNHVDVAGEPVLNTYRGSTSVEIKLRDVRWE